MVSNLTAILESADTVPVLNNSALVDKLRNHILGKRNKDQEGTHPHRSCTPFSFLNSENPEMLASIDYFGPAPIAVDGYTEKSKLLKTALDQDLFLLPLFRFCTLPAALSMFLLALPLLIFVVLLFGIVLLLLLFYTSFWEKPMCPSESYTEQCQNRTVRRVLQ
uniref:Uncharacterized protein n=1 Tax=Glossina pallidipes TaxID=7398 RepID=A0A1B0A5L3_GLOPL